MRNFVFPLRLLLVTSLIVNSMIIQALPQQESPVSDPGVEFLTSEELVNMLFHPVSLINNTSEFFWDIHMAPELTKKYYDDKIGQDQTLSQLSARGEKFRQFYMNSLFDGFGSDLLQWAVNPEIAIYRELIIFKMQEERREAYMPETLAARKAWQEALSRSNLPTTLSYEEASEGADRNPLYQQALENYGRLYLFFLDEKIQKRDSPSFDLEKLVERITAKINQARQANFYQAIKIWQSFRKEPLSFMHVLDQNLESFDLKDLSQSKMSIIKDASEKGKYRYGEKVRSNWVQYILRGSYSPLVHVYKDLDEASAYYRYYDFYPTSLTDLVVIDCGGKQIELSQRNYTEFLYLFPRSKSGRMSAQDWSHLYLQEASHREAMLAEALGLLRVKSYAGRLQQLVNFYRERIKDEARNLAINSASLTNRVRVFNEDPHDHNKLAGIRWFGYERHPDYWHLRDEVSVKAPIYSSQYPRSPYLTYTFNYNYLLRRQGKPIPIREVEKSRDFKKKVKKENSRREFRESSDLKRVKLAVTKFTAWVLGGLVGASIFGATIGVLIGEGYNYFFNPTVEIPISGRRGGANRDSLKMEKGIDHRNFPLEDFLGQKGTPLFDVDSLKPKSPLPSYYNLMSENNLPSEMIETANELGSEPDLVQRVILENEVTPQADIQISTLLPFESRAGRVPILTPDHYELVSIQVTEEGQELQQGTDYKVYRVPNNGLYYFELSDNPIGLKFHYKATLSQGEFKTLPDPMFFLSRPHLLKAVESLKADGATELPHSLEEALESKNRLSLKEIDQIFSQTGFYTFDQEKSTLLWRMGEMKYDILNASRYLREGVYYYQCTGSNFLLGSFLSLAFDEAKIRTRVRVEQINGYVLNNEQGLLGLPGHRRTLVSDTRVPNQYMILDATPKKMDPKYLHLMDQHPFARLEKKEKPPDRRPIKRKLWAFLGRNELKEVDDVESSSPTPENEPIDDMDSIDPESPQVEESQKNKDESADLAEQAELLLDLKRKLRKRILQFLRSNGQSPQSNSVHSSMQELFFLIDRLASFLSKMTSRASLLDELISYRSGHYQAGMDYSQNMDFLEYKRQYMENYGSSREVTLEIVHSIIQRFSQFLHSFDLEVAKKIGNKHGYILDNEARTLAFHILHILEGKRIYSALSSDQEKCRFLLDK